MKLNEFKITEADKSFDTVLTNLKFDIDIITKKLAKMMGDIEKAQELDLGPLDPDLLKWVNKKLLDSKTDIENTQKAIMSNMKS